MLQKFGVEPQAIEQPLDLTILENKMTLAIYLTAPEIENDRRSLNVVYAIRRAKKEGRWPGKAPAGYKNITESNGKKTIVIDRQQADRVRWAFEMIVLAKFTLGSIYLTAKNKGLKCKKNNFLHLIRNPMY